MRTYTSYAPCAAAPVLKEIHMTIDTDKIDDAVLALLYLTSFSEEGRMGAWKGHDWNSLDRLHQKGFIGNPKSKAKSVVLSEEGAKRAKDLFEKMFTKHS
jgi:hypothetical protein